MLWNENDRRILRDLFPQSFAVIERIEKRALKQEIRKKAMEER
jgi:hypothetical protein